MLKHTFYGMLILRSQEDVDAALSQFCLPSSIPIVIGDSYVFATTQELESSIKTQSKIDDLKTLDRASLYTQIQAEEILRRVYPNCTSEELAGMVTTCFKRSKQARDCNSPG